MPLILHYPLDILDKIHTCVLYMLSHFYIIYVWFLDRNL